MEAVQRDALLEHWDLYGGVIQQALDYDYEGMTAEQVRDKVEQGAVLVVQLVDDSKVVCLAALELIELDGESVCHVLSLTGRDIETWLMRFIEGVKEVARGQGCQAVTFKGRPGWRKLLAGEAEELFTVMRCEV